MEKNTTSKTESKPLKIKRNIIKGLKFNEANVPDTEGTLPTIGTSILR
ncbi:hypothetical protein [Chishuiella sp.]|nr:hypothetical protein [Chishuiella sp.]